jgi:hypothetical protein
VRDGQHDDRCIRAIMEGSLLYVDLSRISVSIDVYVVHVFKLTVRHIRPNEKTSAAVVLSECC